MTALRRTLAVLTGTALAAAVAGCGLQNANGYIAPAEPGSIKHYDSLDGVEITVGAKDFTEQLILGNMLATVMQTAGADVTNRTNIAGSNGVRNALLNRTVDISPEYTGTGWISYLLHDEPVKGEEAQWKATAEEDKEKNQLIWLKPAPMNNTYAMALGEAAAEKYPDLKDLSGMKDVPVADRTFCVEDEFYSRNDGFPSMLEAYGLKLGDSVPDDNVLRLDTGVVYDATAKGRCTFGEVFTTDGRIPALKLTVLEDDKEFFPLYNLTEVVQQDLLEAHPEIEEIFAELNPKITNDVMLELNAKVDVDGQEPALVAKEWLVSEGFVS
ncbi:glycine betaine ABC transporter substrate-binding protein [Nocardioides hwasunensis]|uniref:Glycine betaine ABC transporter substrate-binding protein n=1 Tax=Nocardioides hwasunensis TaxID=397258 RepID=A0ABR8MKD6_9ACTN|nr:glycine betaine ABC transporter substrate-binding protein [Nocardioides hwasunensis]MBD3916494.1 glycine betaine ABC transporter substrate-binding protein [Nocardioides hwasunensis]